MDLEGQRQQQQGQQVDLLRLHPHLRGDGGPISGLRRLDCEGRGDEGRWQSGVEGWA